MTEVAAEVMAGLAHDRTFGPVVMFGLGGIFVEVLNDVAFCVVPLRPRDARAMIREVRGFPPHCGASEVHHRSFSVRWRTFC